MAVTAEDKKYLSSAGVAAVQKATDAWNKANAAGDTAGMAKAAADAAAVRSSSNYQASGGSGYTTDSWGRYKAPITPTTSSSSGGSSGSVSDPYAGRDIAGEIITLLTQGGNIDYSKLNSLAQQRDAKIASNPGTYSQFESTQDIINRYLPLAQQNATLTNQLQAQPGTSEIDEIVKLLTNLGSSSINQMSFSEAQKRAGAELNPMYEDAATRLIQGLNADMERRGIYNSPLASGIMTEKQGQLSNEQISAIAERANTLIQNDAEMSLQEKQLRSSTLNSLLSSLIGRESNLAGITGYYEGQPTLSRQQYESDLALKEGDLTGIYDGSQTLAGRAFDLQASTQALNNALNAVETMGSVNTQAQADLLGVPVGTPSWQAREAAAKRAQELQMFNQEISLRRQSNALSAQANAQSKLLADFNKDMIIWETTGISPDTEAMRHYGIVPGSPFTSTAQQTAIQKLQETEAQLGLISAEEEIQFQNRATNFMKTYGVTRGVAQSSLLIIDQSNDLESALKFAKNNKTGLTNEGINPDAVNEALKKYYGIQTTYGGATDTTKTPATVPNSSKNYPYLPGDSGVYSEYSGIYGR